MIPPSVVFGGFFDSTTRTIPRSFESCTIVFDRIGVIVYEKFPDVPKVSTERYTIPLGAVTKVEVIKNVLKEKYFDSWWLQLDAPSNVILLETQGFILPPDSTESVSHADIVFFEEAIAKRVQEAFTHAADLCRGKEPF